MRAKLEKISALSHTSLHARQFAVAHFDAPYHFHPEFELTYIVKSNGTRFVSENATRFAPHDFVLLGSNVPHCWINDTEYLVKRSKLKAESIVLQFDSDFADRYFYQTPEASAIKLLLERSSHGLFFPPALAKKVYPKLMQCVQQKGMQRIILFLEILYELSIEKKVEPISKSSVHTGANKMETERMNSIIDFLVKNSSREITIDEIAEVANLAPASFCRYFKLRTRKTFIEYLNEMRIGRICKYIADTDKPISLIAQQCGFNNSAHFHKTFKNLMASTPHQYRKQMRRLPLMN